MIFPSFLDRHAFPWDRACCPILHVSSQDHTEAFPMASPKERIAFPKAYSIVACDVAYPILQIRGACHAWDVSFPSPCSSMASASFASCASFSSISSFCRNLFVFPLCTFSFSFLSSILSLKKTNWMRKSLVISCVSDVCVFYHDILGHVYAHDHDHVRVHDRVHDVGIQTLVHAWAQSQLQARIHVGDGSLWVPWSDVCACLSFLRMIWSLNCLMTCVFLPLK